MVLLPGCGSVPDAQMTRKPWQAGLALDRLPSDMKRQQEGSGEACMPGKTAQPTASHLVDPFGRGIEYLRVSVTDRCDFRCVYCMAEHMTFLPKKRPAVARRARPAVHRLHRKGVRKLRLTGGEPLVRKNIMWLVRALVAASRDRRARRTDADHQRQPARQLCRRTRRRRRQAHQRLARHARPEQDSSAITRWGDLDKVLDGHRRRAGGRAQRQDQRRRAEGRQRGRDRRD